MTKLECIVCLYSIEDRQDLSFASKSAVKYTLHLRLKTGKNIISRFNASLSLRKALYKSLLNNTTIIKSWGSIVLNKTLWALLLVVPVSSPCDLTMQYHIGHVASMLNVSHFITSQYTVNTQQPGDPVLHPAALNTQAKTRPNRWTTSQKMKSFHRPRGWKQALQTTLSNLPGQQFKHLTLMWRTHARTHTHWHTLSLTDEIWLRRVKTMRRPTDTQRDRVDSQCLHNPQTCLWVTRSTRLCVMLAQWHLFPVVVSKPSHVGLLRKKRGLNGKKQEIYYFLTYLWGLNK